MMHPKPYQTGGRFPIVFIVVHVIIAITTRHPGYGDRSWMMILMMIIIVDDAAIYFCMCVHVCMSVCVIMIILSIAPSRPSATPLAP